MQPQKWIFYKCGNRMTLSIEQKHNSLHAFLRIENMSDSENASVLARNKDGVPAIVFESTKTIKINGKSTDIKGVILSNFDTSADTFSDFVDVNKIVSCFENAKHEIEEKRQKLERERKIAHDAEYAAIMSGEKPLNIRYNDGENCFGPVAYGVNGNSVYRDITDAELKAVTIIHKYGKFAKSMVRM